MYIKKLRTDFGGYFFYYCRRKIYSLNRMYHTAIMYILLFFKNIKIGKSSMFYNRAYFCRHPESEIIIGSHCRFDSTKFKNLIGVNKRCIIATLLPNAKLEIGNLNGFSGVRIGCAENISIGNDCLVGANVTITDSDWHAIDPQERHNEYAQKTQPVKIGNNVFIGLNSIILKGSEIGDNSVIGAGSVVSGTIPPNVIAAGNPCKIIKRI